MKYGFIYITTNILTNKKYIGMKKYSKGWESYLGSSKTLLNDILKYGRDNFKRDIIEECDTAKDLQNKEIYYLEINNVLDNDLFYNQSIPHKDFRIKGKTNSSKGRTWEEIYGEEESKKKREKAKSKRTLETRIKMSNSRKGIKYSDETKRRIKEGVIRYYQTLNKINK